MSNTKYIQTTATSPLSWIAAIVTAIIGYNVNDQSVFWAVVDFFFWPLAWIKWLICQEVNISIIKDSFSFFLQ
jgi:uncharacterized membrane protein